VHWRDCLDCGEFGCEEIGCCSCKEDEGAGREYSASDRIEMREGWERDCDTGKERGLRDGDTALGD
jgi:hypothetical protein